ncbi:MULTISPECIES: guanosine-3',5'-bis(diphosphate) 3'-pyrophosphohydrolase [Bacillus]|uniref:guanosine-3',5'-bis(diphosphate) 3'-pyrophosphohydrolase n=1 Tax=Bacillus TaxID=1386 RepID=UPI0002EA2A16|nr:MULTISPECIES: guanosine-3',5'-bis(diphosphate) 3'-pyrophosphohydrolase [Bacillus]
MISEIDRALQLALENHLGQKDKGGSPNILHPIRIMHNVNSNEEKIVALLHDIVEDTNVTLEDLHNEGFSNYVVQAVDCLTKRKGEKYQLYLQRVANNPIARTVKMEDIKDNSNLSRIQNPSEKDYAKLEKYKKSLAFLQKNKSSSPPIVK